MAKETEKEKKQVANISNILRNPSVLAALIVSIALIVSSYMIYSGLKYLLIGGTVIKAEVTDFMDSLRPIDPVSIDEYDPSIGNSRDVIMVEFTDYQCPFCARHARNTFPLLKENYIDTRKITYVILDLPLESIHPYARRMAQYANCVYKEYGPDTYLEFRRWIYENQDVWSGGNVDELVQTELSNMGLDIDTILSCANSDEVNEEINADLSEVQRYRVTGTPGFAIFLKASKIDNSDYEELRAIMDELLGFGVRYNIWKTPDEEYIVVKFSGALPYEYFDRILSLAAN